MLRTEEALANKWKRACQLAINAPTNVQQDERELTLIQIELLAEILRALWRSEGK